MSNQRPPNVVFYPELPHPKTTVLKVLAYLGFAPARRIDPDTVCAFKWRDATTHTLAPRAVELLSVVPLYNARCVDISKRAIAKVNLEVFGRALAVDPSTFRGTMVCKSDRNATHDGTILEGPLTDVDPDKTYSLLIDNSDLDEVVDYRVYVSLDDIPVVAVRRRPRSRRFANMSTTAVLGAPLEVFSGEECRQMVACAAALGLDFGELDAVRDVTTGQLWVVDVNNTPYGPSTVMSDVDRQATVARIAASFQARFLAPSPDPQRRHGPSPA